MRRLLLAVALCSAASAASAQALVPSAFDATVAGAIASPTPPGSNVVGKVGIDQSVPGVTNAVQLADGAYLSGTCTDASCTDIVTRGVPFIGPIDTTGIGTLDFQVLTAGVATTLQWQASDDPVCSSASNWSTQIRGYGAVNDSNNTNFTTVNFTGTFQIPVKGHCMRLMLSGFTSGTFTAQVTLRSAARHITIDTPVALASMPANGVFVSAADTKTTAALSATLSSAQRLTYVCGVDITSAGTTAPTPVTATVTAGSRVFSYAYNPLTAGNSLQLRYQPCIPTSAQNTSIVVAVPALGAGTATATLNVFGYQGY